MVFNGYWNKTRVFGSNCIIQFQSTVQVLFSTLYGSGKKSRTATNNLSSCKIKKYFCCYPMGWLKSKNDQFELISSHFLCRNLNFFDPLEKLFERYDPLSKLLDQFDPLLSHFSSTRNFIILIDLKKTFERLWSIFNIARNVFDPLLKISSFVNNC